jgi:ribosomal protein L11 methyltransferase
MTMEWLEVSVRVNQEAAEAVAEVLSRYAPQGVAFEMHEDAEAEVTVKAYLAIDAEIETRQRKVEEALWHLSQIWDVIPEPAFRRVPDQDWTATWKEQIPVLHLGSRIVIKPSWRTYTPTEGDLVLELDPGIAFGTGLHPTTQLCVAAIEEFVQQGSSVLDMGTGTGILALVAAQLGAAPILAVDNDENAVIAARRNAEANGLASQIEMRYGSLADVETSYDIIVANILAPIITAMAGAGLAKRLREDGVLIASGILREQAVGVTESLERGGLQVTEVRQMEEWVAILARHRFDEPRQAI